MQILQLDIEKLDQLAINWKNFIASPEGSKNLSVNQTPKTVRVEGDEHFDKILKSNSVSCMTELALLTDRSWRTTMRDPAGTIGKFVQALFFSVLLALFFANLTKDDNGVQDRSGVLFMETINLTFLNVMTAITVFPPERAVFLQEQVNGSYSAWLYYLSKVVAELPLNIVIPTIYSIITYWSWGLANTAVAYFNHLAIVLTISYVGNAFGLFAAALFPKAEIAMTLTPLMIMPQMLVAGLFANTARLEPYWIWLNYISFPRYAYKAFMVNEFNHVGPLCGGIPETSVINGTIVANTACKYYTGDEVLQYEGFTKTTDTVWFSIVLMMVIMLVFRFLGAFALWLHGSSSRAQLVFEANYRKEVSHQPDAVELR